MNNEAVFEGCFVGVKPVKSRGVYVFNIEVSEEMANECLRRIGGLPRASESRHVAVALLTASSPMHGDASGVTSAERDAVNLGEG